MTKDEIKYWAIYKKEIDNYNKKEKKRFTEDKLQMEKSREEIFNKQHIRWLEKETLYLEKCREFLDKGFFYRMFHSLPDAPYNPYPDTRYENFHHSFPLYKNPNYEDFRTWYINKKAEELK